VLRREVEEGQEDVSILGEAAARRLVLDPFCPSWAAVGEQVLAGYAAFFFSLYRTRLSVIAHASRSGGRA